MKEWKKPEVKIFNVKIDENIAASGDGSGYMSGYISFYTNGISRGGGNYRYNSSNQIQDTSYTWFYSGSEKCVSSSDDWQNDIQIAIRGCSA